jgi:DNA end-binding protein Ku
VANAEIGKGYEYARDQVVPISDEELSNLPLPTAKAIEIAAFVPLDSIDPLRIADGYYLTPDGAVAAKPYKLLVQALGRSSKVAVAKYAWSGRERLGQCGCATTASFCTPCAGRTRSPAPGFAYCPRRHSPPRVQ